VRMELRTEREKEKKNQRSFRLGEKMFLFTEDLNGRIALHAFFEFAHQGGHSQNFLRNSYDLLTNILIHFL
jgi:hypothetical protein